MTFKTLTVASVLAVLPTLTLAMGCQHSKQQAQTCITGSQWDTATQACIPVANS